MTDRLPATIDPFRLARAGQALSGRLTIAPMRRLADSVYDRDGVVKVELFFGYDESDRATVRGNIEGTLELVCQRCLMGLPYHCDIEVNLALVTSEWAAQPLESGYELLVVAQTPLSLSELIEDELILALPVVPTHDRGQCAVNERYRANVGDERDLATNPFRILGEARDG